MRGLIITVPLAHQSAHPFLTPWKRLESEGFPYPCNELSEFERYIGGRSIRKQEGRERLKATPAPNAGQTVCYLFGCGV